MNQQNFDFSDQVQGNKDHPHQRCPFCGTRPATLLCDFVIGFQWKGEAIGNARCISRGSLAFTCDRPICETCAAVKARGFIDYTKGGRRCGEPFALHLCPQCQGHSETSGFNPVTKAEADAIRARMWKRSEGRLRVEQ